MDPMRIPAARAMYNEARIAFEQGAWTVRHPTSQPVAGPRPTSRWSLPELVTAARRLLDAADRTEGERRILSVLFCDLVGSTSLVASIGARRYREIILAIQQICVEAVTSFEVESPNIWATASSLLSYPQAHEDVRVAPCSPVWP